VQIRTIFTFGAAFWCRKQKLEVTRSRAYKKNDQAFVEQKNGAVVRRLMGYGRFEGADTARVMARLYAAARLYIPAHIPGLCGTLSNSASLDTL
jgi:hypothetical protein